MSVGQRVHNLGPDPRSSPANEPIVAGCVWAEVVWQIAPWRPRPQDPKDAIEDTPVIHPWHAARLVRQHRLDGSPLAIGEFIAYDSRLQFGSLNHASVGIINPLRPVMKIVKTIS